VLLKIVCKQREDNKMKKEKVKKQKRKTKKTINVVLGRNVSLFIAQCIICDIKNEQRKTTRVYTKNKNKERPEREHDSQMAKFCTPRSKYRDVR
jgi:hypothetical protein